MYKFLLKITAFYLLLSNNSLGQGRVNLPMPFFPLEQSYKLELPPPFGETFLKVNLYSGNQPNAIEFQFSETLVVIPDEYVRELEFFKDPRFGIYYSDQEGEDVPSAFTIVFQSRDAAEKELNIDQAQCDNPCTYYDSGISEITITSSFEIRFRK